MTITANAAVVFVHGLWMNGIELAWLRAQVAKAGYATHQFRYSTVRYSAAENAEALFRFAQCIDARELHFVGHSLGGIVVLSMLARFHAELPRGRVVLIGSPVRGSNAARRMLDRRWGRVLLGAAARHGLEADHAPEWNGQRELATIAGTRSIGVGRLLGPLAVPNDGTVALEETRIDDAVDHLELPVTHVTMLFSREVAKGVTSFLAGGRLSRE